MSSNCLLNSLFAAKVQNSQNPFKKCILDINDILDQNISVLIVDDVEYNIMSLSTILGNIPKISRIDKLHNGQEAVERV